MKADAFAKLVQEPRKSGTGWTARCPAHDDEHASLSFADGRSGLVVHCHAGCAPDAITTKLGLRLADLFEAPTTATGAIIGATTLKK